MNDKSGFIDDVIQWDVRSWSRALSFWERALDSEKGDEPLMALELGSREGGLSLWLASKGIDVVCSDLRNAEATASPLHKKYSQFEKRFSYQNIDATDIPYEEKFDVVIFKSVLGGVGVLGKEAQYKAMSEIHKALKPGGMLLFAENLTASSLHRSLRRRFVKWGNQWVYVDFNEIDALLSPFSRFRFETTGFTATFGRSESQRRLLARLDGVFFNHMVPQRSRYIAYGYAVK